MADPREVPRNLQCEPAYPNHPDTVMLSMSHPDWTGHLKSSECEAEEPHRIEDCGLWRIEEKQNG